MKASKINLFACIMYFNHKDSEMSDMDQVPAMDNSSAEDEKAPLYCICRKPDINCFMMWDLYAVYLKGIYTLCTCVFLAFAVA